VFIKEKGPIAGYFRPECRQILLKGLKTSMFLLQTREGGPASIDSASLSVVDQICSRTGFPVSSTSMKVLISILTVAFFAFALGGCRRKGNPNSNAAASATPAASYNSSNAADREQAQNDARVHLEHGNELFQNNQDEEALAAYKQAIERNPEFAEAYYKLGITHAVLEQDKESEAALKKAIELYKKSIQENSKDADAFFNLGESYRSLRQYEDAVRAYKQAVHLQPEDPEMFYELGVTQIKLAQYSEASNALQKAVDLDPNYYRASDALEEAREGAKRIRDGKKHQEEMLKKQAKKGEEGAPSPTPAPN
jgi:tetratricopeptide (TPR) repeat protein